MQRPTADVVLPCLDEAAALPTVLVTYDLGDYAEAAAVRALAGEIPIQGRLPVSLGEGAGVGFGLTRAAAAPSPP